MEAVDRQGWAGLMDAELPEEVTVAQLVGATGLRQRSVRSWLRRHGVAPCGTTVAWRGAAWLYPLARIVELAERSPGSGNWTRGEGRRGIRY